MGFNQSLALCCLSYGTDSEDIFASACYRHVWDHCGYSGMVQYFCENITTLRYMNFCV